MMMLNAVTRAQCGTSKHHVGRFSERKKNKEKKKSRSKWQSFYEFLTKSESHLKRKPVWCIPSGLHISTVIKAAAS